MTGLIIRGRAANGLRWVSERWRWRCMAAPGNLNFARALTRLDRPISKLPSWQSQSSLHTKYLGCTWQSHYGHTSGTWNQQLVLWLPSWARANLKWHSGSVLVIWNVPPDQFGQSNPNGNRSASKSLHIGYVNMAHWLLTCSATMAFC